MITHRGIQEILRINEESLIAVLSLYIEDVKTGVRPPENIEYVEHIIAELKSIVILLQAIERGELS